MDSDNAVVKLCAEGMMVEGQGYGDQARELFAQAWAQSKDDVEACIAAHYLARHQGSAEQTLYWNREALRRADSSGDDRVRGYYPSLYLNLGRSYELMGDVAAARRYYDLAAASAADLPDDGYSAMVRRGIGAGQQRVEASGERR